MHNQPTGVRIRDFHDTLRHQKLTPVPSAPSRLPKRLTPSPGPQGPPRTAPSPQRRWRLVRPRRSRRRSSRTSHDRLDGTCDRRRATCTTSHTTSRRTRNAASVVARALACRADPPVDCCVLSHFLIFALLPFLLRARPLLHHPSSSRPSLPGFGQK